MRTIYKYEVQASEFTLELPVTATILSVDVQSGKPFMWVLQETEEPTRPRRFFAAGTGHVVPNHIKSDRFIGTFLLQGGALVFHLFEVE